MRVGVRAGAAVLPAVEPGDRRVVVRRELEVEEREVLLDPLGRRGLREDDVPALDVPAQDDLGGRPAEPLGDVHDHRVVEHAALGDRRPRLGDDAVLAAVVVDLRVDQVRVQLDLVDRGDDVALGREALEVGDLEVRDADRAGPAVRLELLEHLPGGGEVAVVERRQRPVDQEEVDVVRAELGERRLERAARVVGRVVAVVELAGDEDVRAVDVRSRRCRRGRRPRCGTSRRCRCGGSRRRARAGPPRRSPPAGSGRRRSRAAGSCCRRSG